jgi:ABC-type antimicrobial peptide transport system permease subunit
MACPEKAIYPDCPRHARRSFPFSMVVPWKPAAVVFSLAALVGLWPAYHATRLRIAEAIAYE